ncbi:glycosyltransferase family 15 protein [Colletotrichum scovillei]|nr:glycosyltransferase family 15 protein [Colletotrichum scovillei]
MLRLSLAFDCAVLSSTDGFGRRGDVLEWTRNISSWLPCNTITRRHTFAAVQFSTLIWCCEIFINSTSGILEDPRDDIPSTAEWLDGTGTTLCTPASSLMPHPSADVDAVKAEETLYTISCLAAWLPVYMVR